jgi:hypothetical protein
MLSRCRPLTCPAECTVAEEEPAVKGWNWGDLKFSGSTLAFMVDSKPAFEINLGIVSNATPHQKTEAVVEFHRVWLPHCGALTGAD